MLATLGFGVTAVCFGFFAYTFDTHVLNKTSLKLSQYSYAYYCLALALLIWGVAAAVGGESTLRNAVLIGNALLLLGTLFMISVWLDNKNRLALGLAALVAIVLLYIRIVYYSPLPYLSNGILIFNTQMAAAIGIALLFVLIWLPVNIKVAKLVTHEIGQDNIASMYSAIYVTATVSALIFLAARRTITVALSFVAIGICFALLIRSNILVAKIMESRHAK